MTHLAATTTEYTILHLFCGLGGGALGFQRSRAAHLGIEGRFRTLAGIDNDPGACADFTKLTGAPSVRADIAKMTAPELRAATRGEAPDAVFLSPPCLPGSGLVLTPAGQARIDSMRAGDMVLTHRGRYRRVRAVGREVFAGEMIGLRINGTVDRQEFTPDHPMWIRRVVRRDRKQQLGEQQFLRAGDLRPGDRVGFPVDYEEPGTAFAFLSSLGWGSRSADPSLWFLIGAYLGDGYRRRDDKPEVVFCAGCVDGRKAQRIREALKAIGQTWYEDHSAGPTNIKIRVSGRDWTDLMGPFGDGAENKHIPTMLMNVERAALDALVDGYRTTDGSSAPRRMGVHNELQARWKVPSVSLQLLRDLQRLLLRVGVFGCINIAWAGGPQVIEGREVLTLPRWEITVRLDPKKRTIHEFIDGAVWVRIRAITHRATQEPVWNLDVEEDDTFCAPMMATHNCKGFSGLLPKKRAALEKYQVLNRLVFQGLFLVLETWPNALPGLLILENVPRIRQRGAELLLNVRSLLARYGYVFHESTHNCGELGGLAQNRTRYLLVARLPSKVPTFVYKPAKRRVRAIGEVLGTLPMPDDPRGGPMHRCPRLEWGTWKRLALIPAGGDWRDLPGAQPAVTPNRHTSLMRVTDWNEAAPTVTGATRPNGGGGAISVADSRMPEAFNRVYGIIPWDAPSGTVTGNGRPSAGAFSVADPRLGTFVADPRKDSGPRFNNVYRVVSWQEPAGAVTAGSGPSSSGTCVADPRLPEAEGRHHNKFRVEAWQAPAHTVTGSDRIGSGAASIADPRLGGRDWSWRARPGLCGVLDWNAPSSTITGKASVTSSNCPASVADPRLRRASNYGVLDWAEAAGAVVGAADVSQGRTAVADPRPLRNGALGVLDWGAPAGTVTGEGYPSNGAFSVSDPRLPADDDRPESAPLIVALDGTWHRPLTTLELAALQSLPVFGLDGAPLELHGKSQAKWRERIGNAVPADAAQAMGDAFLLALLGSGAKAGAGFVLSSGDVWVRRRTADTIRAEG